MTEEELISFAKFYLKPLGFKKKNKRWLKTEEDFTLCFYIQSSCFDYNSYYIRPGIFINALLPTNLVYGHYMKQLEQTTPQQVMNDFEKFCEEWTNKKSVKSKLIEFLEWEKDNSLEKRRLGQVDYSNAPCDYELFFEMDDFVKEYILENF